jgi:signal transduction histidine kinase/ActR/RegA family two-component response regulator
MPAITLDPALAADIRAEQVRVVYGHLPAQMTSNFLVIVVIWWILYNLPTVIPLLIWTVVLSTLLITRLILCKVFLSRPRTTAEILPWQRRLVIYALLSGVLWGVLNLIAISGDRYQFLGIWAILIIMANAGLAPNAPYRPCFLAYSIPVSLSTATAILFYGGPYAWALAFTGYANLGVLLVFSRNVERTMIESIRIRYEKQLLVEELSLQKQEAERANMAKSKFLAAASHDLRQPLHALGLYLDTMNTELDKEATLARQRQLAQKMGVAVTALNDLFQSLLDISRLDAGIVEPNIIHHAVSSLFERMEVRYSPFAKLKNLELIFQHNKTVIMSDPILLERILDNLISNAIRYTDSGSVTISAIDAGNSVTIEVADTGPGIPASEQENIFTEFYQLHNPERDRTKGLGLGLSIAKRLCLLLNCTLELQSQPDQGSKFRLHVPTGDIKRVFYTPSNLPRFDWDLDDVCIMVIDDEADVLDAMHELLSSWGCNPVCVDSAKEAVKAVRQGHRPELVIADYRLRESQTGVEAIRSIGEAMQTRLPGILITGDSAPERLQEAMHSGFKLLHKPVNASQLRTVVNRLLIQHRKG